MPSQRKYTPLYQARNVTVCTYCYSTYSLWGQFNVFEQRSDQEYGKCLSCVKQRHQFPRVTQARKFDVSCTLHSSTESGRSGNQWEITNEMMRHIHILYVISMFVVFVAASVLPTLQLENGFHHNSAAEKTSASHSSSDHSSFGHNREKQMFSSTYSTKGRRNHMEDYCILSQDCCFAGTFQLYPRSLLKLKSSHNSHSVSRSTWFAYILYCHLSITAI